MQTLAGASVTVQASDSGLLQVVPTEMQSVVHKEETVTSDYMEIEGTRQAVCVAFSFLLNGKKIKKTGIFWFIFGLLLLFY